MAFKYYDPKKATEIKLERRNVENYTCPDNRKLLGHDDLWYRSKMNNVPRTVRSAMNDVFHGKAGLKKAIKMMCHQCIGYAEAKSAIANCSGSMCPLYSYRPYKNEQEKVKSNE